VDGMEIRKQNSSCGRLSKTEGEMTQKEIIDVTSRVQFQLIRLVEHCLMVDLIASMP